MNQPNPWILFIGGGSLLNVALLLGGLAAPAWVRYGAMAIVVALGLTCMGLALARQFQKKPERVRYQPKRVARVDLPPELSARLKDGGNRAPGGAPKGGAPEPPAR